jgi:hypothetical protein
VDSTCAHPCQSLLSLRIVIISNAELRSDRANICLFFGCELNSNATRDISIYVEGEIGRIAHMCLISWRDGPHSSIVHTENGSLSKPAGAQEVIIDVSWDEGSLEALNI